jgi:hypothetical protein
MSSAKEFKEDVQNTKSKKRNALDGEKHTVSSVVCCYILL